MTPETLEKYLKLAKDYGLLNTLIERLITPDNIKAIVSGAVEGAIKAKQGE